MKFICLNEGKIKKMDELVPKLIRKYKVPGISLAFVQGNEDIWCKQFGVKHSYKNEPIKCNTIFEAASLTKPVVAYAALKLHERGILDLDTPLGEYLPFQYLPEEPLCKDITSRHILSHMCGFPNWRGKESLKILFTPGEKFSYSGEGFVYLQKVIEHIVQMPLDQYINENIFEPFEMKDSSLIWLDKYEKQASYPHDEHGEPKEFFKAKKPNAAWSLYTTPEEYTKFIRKIMDDSSAYEHALTQDTLIEMIKPQVKVNESISWGLGWGIEDYKSSIWHWGDNGEFKAFTLLFLKEKVGIIIMTNGFNGLKVSKDIICELFVDDYPAFSKYLGL